MLNLHKALADKLAMSGWVLTPAVTAPQMNTSKLSARRGISQGAAVIW